MTNGLYPSLSVFGSVRDRLDLMDASGGVIAKIGAAMRARRRVAAQKAEETGLGLDHLYADRTSQHGEAKPDHAKSTFATSVSSNGAARSPAMASGLPRNG